MATINKKLTKAHKSKKVVKAHQGMAHVPRQRPPELIRQIDQPTGRPRPTTPKRRPTKAIDLSNPITRKNYTDGLVGNLVAENPFNKPTRRPTRRPTPSPIKTVYDAPMPTRTTDTVRKPTRGSAGRPMRVPQESMTGSDGSVYPAVKPMDERARRRRDNALKSEVDEMTRQFNKQRPRRPRRPTAQPIRQPRPIRLPKDFGGRKPRQNSMGLGPLPNNFNPLESTALTDRFNKLNQNNLNQNRLQMQRNKGGDIKKYATGGLNKGMTKSRTKYGTVDNKKK